MSAQDTRWTTDQYGNSVRLAASVSDNQRYIAKDTGFDFQEYKKNNEIDALMRQRHGVRM